jgi:hypothetical protein
MSQDVSAAQPKTRSCILCRQRKVRCDKESPCSNCRNANLACRYPSADPVPRWARRLDRIERLGTNVVAANNPNIDRVTARLRNMEALVKDFSRELEEAQVAARSVGSAIENTASVVQRDMEGPTSSQGGPSSGTAYQQSGRLVPQDASRSRYINSSFWSRIDDEVYQYNSLSHLTV